MQRIIWDSAAPLIIRSAHSLPATAKWFRADHSFGQNPFSDYIHAFEDVLVPYEFTSHSSRIPQWSTFLQWLGQHSAWRVPELEDILHAAPASADDTPAHFHQFQAPLGLLVKAGQYNADQPGGGQLTHLYIAQSDIRDLPGPLSDDLRVPDIVQNSPKGDIYSSSVWLGLQPTYTPLHRDPNPNIFCQLRGHKTVRFLPPKVALGVFNKIQSKLGMRASARLRGTEMMQGLERDLLHKTMWLPSPEETHFSHIAEATVGPGDILFIPQGWWHTFISQGREGELNASANWWCR
ncbi:cupin-like domain-containing protein [Microdochium nivale]|nr:cupin-like domain-containing protein [Microdochium nivale]